LYRFCTNPHIYYTERIDKRYSICTCSYTPGIKYLYKCEGENINFFFFNKTSFHSILYFFFLLLIVYRYCSCGFFITTKNLAYLVRNIEIRYNIYKVLHIYIYIVDFQKIEKLDNSIFFPLKTLITLNVLLTRI
jgi:hypothetical protein